MNYKNYIWDLGGTLLDNYGSSTQAFMTVLFQHERIATYDEIYSALKVSTDFAIKQFALGIPYFLSEYKKLESLALKQPMLFDGAVEMLQQVVKLNGFNFMISHRNRQVLEILSTAGIDKYFTEIVTSENGFPRKPAADSINYLINKYQLNRVETVAIGDRAIDIEAGRAATVDTIFFDSKATNSEATYNISSLKELV